jgi:hypothetical protein
MATKEPQAEPFPARLIRRRSISAANDPPTREGHFFMSKGMDSKKTDKKQPIKTMKEKKAAKKEKKAGK